MPGYSASFVPTEARILFALAVSFVLTPLLVDRLPPLPGTVSGLFLLIGGEVVVGSFFGMITRVMVSMLQTAGTVISFVSSLANALVQDPVVDQQSATVAGFLGNLGVLLLFATNMHHTMLKAVIDSYALFEPGQALVWGDFSQVMARKVAESFAIGVQISAPLIITAFAYYLGLGLLGRLMPNLPVFFVGVPAQVMIQIAVLVMALSGMMMVFLNHFEESLLHLTEP
jgi:flagellar biosynthetic protein FliR